MLLFFVIKPSQNRQSIVKYSFGETGKCVPRFSEKVSLRNKSYHNKG